MMKGKLESAGIWTHGERFIINAVLICIGIKFQYQIRLPMDSKTSIGLFV